MRKQAERFCFEDTHLHVTNCASICILGPASESVHAIYFHVAYIFMIAWRGFSALELSFVAFIVYTMQILCIISNAALYGMHTFELDRWLCRRRDGKELVEHVLRIVLGFDL